MIELTNYAKQIRKVELTASVSTLFPPMSTTKNVKYNSSGEPINFTIDSDGVTLQRVGIARNKYGQTKSIGFGGKINGQISKVLDNKNYNVEEEFTVVYK